MHEYLLVASACWTPTVLQMCILVKTPGSNHVWMLMQVDEECPKCSTRGVEFFTMQLRSADEGSTVFYECKECGCATAELSAGVHTKMPPDK
jgi:hypothetical protein